MYREVFCDKELAHMIMETNKSQDLQGESASYRQTQESRGFSSGLKQEKQDVQLQGCQAERIHSYSGRVHFLFYSEQAFN